MAKKLHGVNLDQYHAVGKKVIQRATGEVVHRAPTGSAAKDVARRMHGVTERPRWSFSHGVEIG